MLTVTHMPVLSASSSVHKFIFPLNWNRVERVMAWSCEIEFIISRIFSYKSLELAVILQLLSCSACCGRRERPCELLSPTLKISARLSRSSRIAQREEKHNFILCHFTWVEDDDGRAQWQSRRPRNLTKLFSTQQFSSFLRSTQKSSIRRWLAVN